jgi:hypothetical protein
MDPPRMTLHIKTPPSEAEISDTMTPGLLSPDQKTSRDLNSLPVEYFHAVLMRSYINFFVTELEEGRVPDWDWGEEFASLLVFRAQSDCDSPESPITRAHVNRWNQAWCFAHYRDSDIEAWEILRAEVADQFAASWVLEQKRLNPESDINTLKLMAPLRPRI